MAHLKRSLVLKLRQFRLSEEKLCQLNRPVL
jgi:hypothetical protein